MVMRWLRFAATLTFLTLFKSVFIVLLKAKNKKVQSVEWLCGSSVLTMSF